MGGNWRAGTGGSKLGTGNLGQGTGGSNLDRELEAGNWDRNLGRELGSKLETGNLGQGTGNRELEGTGCHKTGWQLP